MAHATFFSVGLGILLLAGVRLQKSFAALQDSLAQIKRLEGLLPICANCKKIRREQGDSQKQEDWIRVETYIQDRTNAQFTHGLCPECFRSLYPTLVQSNPKDP